MAKSKKFTPSQLRWLAESLTNNQIAYLLEDNGMTNGGGDVDASKPISNPTASVTPTAPAAQKEVAPVDNRKQIVSICKNIMNGGLAKIEPKQLLKFLSDAKIEMKNVAESIKYAIEFLSKKVADKSVNLNVFQNVFASCSNLMGALMANKNQMSESIISDAKKKGVNVQMLAENIRQNNVYTVFNEGKKLNYDEKLNNDLARLKRMNESLTKEFGDNIPLESKKQIKNIQKAIDESFKKNSFEHRINEYYQCCAQIKNLNKLMEMHNIKLTKYDNLRKVTKSVEDKMNENMSALKFALNYYKKSK